MKYESKGKIIDEFVGLKSTKNVVGEENKKRKGIYQRVVKNRKHEEYTSVLFNKIGNET